VSSIEIGSGVAAAGAKRGGGLKGYASNSSNNGDDGTFYSATLSMPAVSRRPRMATYNSNTSNAGSGHSHTGSVRESSFGVSLNSQQASSMQAQLANMFDADASGTVSGTSGNLSLRSHSTHSSHSNTLTSTTRNSISLSRSSSDGSQYGLDIDALAAKMDFSGVLQPPSALVSVKVYACAIVFHEQ
jgi:hypothetical protein